MTQQWGGAPDQWNRSQSPWGSSFGGQSPWPTQPNTQQPTQQAGYQQANYPQQGYGQPGLTQNHGQPGMFPAPSPQRPRRNPFGTLLRAAVVVILVIVAFSVIRSVVGGLFGGTTGSTGGSTSGNGGTGGTTQYENEGYQAPPADFNPPDLHSPTTVGEAQKWLTDNAIYSENVPSPTNCTETPITEGLSKAQMETRLNALMACLMQVWEPPMKAAGFEMPRPPVTVYTSAITTACGVMKEVNAAYCAGDQHVYYALPLLNALPDQVASTKYAAEDVIAHEFGHAVQARSGILISDKALEQRASKSDALIMSRRAEQQADCFGGLFVGSVAQSQGFSQNDLQSLVDMTYYLGDDVLSGQANIQGDHGLGTNRQAWFAKGVQTNQIGVCNTWTVPASQVR